MILRILGDGTLATATKICCQRHFTVTNDHKFYPDIIWCCYDTPVAENGCPDINDVLARIRGHIITDQANLVLISSQWKVGTTKRLEDEFPDVSFAYQPENIRVASAIADFENQSRIVVGRRSDAHDALLKELFAPFTKNLIITDPETAEMCKHALNCYLGMTIAFANEIGSICQQVGADMKVVTDALRTDPRVSPKAPLRPGAPFGGGHLERDLFCVREIAAAHRLSLPILEHVTESNRIERGLV